ncbi:hypothetical protein DAI22_04g129975 [Oryza sativa Japonica Group]|nr:hypothetical protein DAI22_04g129975 [Oryza sativa Japonica Group]
MHCMLMHARLLGRPLELGSHGLVSSCLRDCQLICGLGRHRKFVSTRISLLIMNKRAAVDPA